MALFYNGVAMARKRTWLVLACILTSVAGQSRSFRFPETTPAVASLINGQLRDQQAILGSLSASESPSRSLRLSGGTAPNLGIVEVFSRGKWKVLCDGDDFFGLSEANVVCRQLGWEGAVHSDRGLQSSLANISASSDESLAASVRCRGEERSLEACTRRLLESDCERNLHAVAVACNRPSFALCPPDAEPFGDSCYSIHTLQKKSFRDAQGDCESSGGHLLEVDSGAENDFVGDWMVLKGVPSGSFWIGGVLDSLAGKSFLLWHHSVKPASFSGLSNELTLETTSGVVIRQIGSRMHWFPSPLNGNHSFVCESPQLDVGCLSEDTGAEYLGAAARGESGAVCLPWNTPELTQVRA